MVRTRVPAAVLHCSIAGREPASPGEVRRSDHQCQFIGRRSNSQPRKGVDPKSVMASPKVLHEGVASDDDAGGPIPFQAPHRAQPGLQASVVGLAPVVGVLSGVVGAVPPETRVQAFMRSPKQVGVHIQAKPASRPTRPRPVPSRAS